MPSDILLVAYGTLRNNSECQPVQHLITGRLGSVVIPGEIYHVDDCYPGLIHGWGEVQAELITVANQESIQAIDAYEDYFPQDPEGSLFTRSRIRLPRHETWAWVYYYNQPVLEEQLIPGGDWLAKQKTPA